MELTPGKAAHDTWCAEDDWDELDDEERGLWEATARAGHDAIVAAARAPRVAVSQNIGTVRRGSTVIGAVVPAEGM